MAAEAQVGTAEGKRLRDEAARVPHANWKRWGPYISERQWGTVREDYSPDGDCWNHFTHDQARSRAYRWGEDGLMGFTDRECRLCFAVCLWNGRDPILKERLFGLTGPEGNHGEDVKELYYYLESTPTHSYVKMLYKYPHSAFPYGQLVEENRRRGRDQLEYEVLDTGVFDNNAYFDVETEYAKASPDDMLIRITVHNRGDEAAPIHVLPTLWFKNSWSWGCTHEGCLPKPRLERTRKHGEVKAKHLTLGNFFLECGAGPDGRTPEMLFTENESNYKGLWGVENNSPYVKDAFHRYVVNGQHDAVNPGLHGTKMAAHYQATVPAHSSIVIKMRLTAEVDVPQNDTDRTEGTFDDVFETRRKECQEFYDQVGGLEHLTRPEREVMKQSYAGLMATKQYYEYVVKAWLEGDPDQPKPPASRYNVRNGEWQHLFNRDVISMPDKWEYPWCAAWDLAFQTVAFARVDPHFAKDQLLLFLREWYMHPNGQLPAYEFNFSDVNPPVHAWACFRVYQLSGKRGERDRDFLARSFQKLLLNFTWWVNRKDPSGRHIFGGGFLGLDNIGLFDRSRPLPDGGQLAQADGTAWMAFYCGSMLQIALELAQNDVVYEDMASKFFEHFVAIINSMNTLGGNGLWDEQDGFYYDQAIFGDNSVPLRVRSLVGVISLLAAVIIEERTLKKLPGFRKRLDWFMKNQPDMAQHISEDIAHFPHVELGAGQHRHMLLAIPSKERLVKVLRYVLDENELLSNYGVRSLSKAHENPYTVTFGNDTFSVQYAPGESNTAMFGGNSNWRGPIWFPINYLLVDALERYHYFYGNDLKVECPTGSGCMMTLQEVSTELRRRMNSLFLPDQNGHRPHHGGDPRYATDPHFRDLVLMYEHFHGDTGRGLGASHQSGWTALLTELMTKPVIHN